MARWMCGCVGTRGGGFPDTGGVANSTNSRREGGGEERRRKRRRRGATLARVGLRGTRGTRGETLLFRLGRGDSN